MTSCDTPIYSTYLIEVVVKGFQVKIFDEVLTKRTTNVTVVKGFQVKIFDEL